MNKYDLLNNEQIPIVINPNKEKYFNLNHVRQAVKAKGYDIHNAIFICDGPRNIGKSVGTFNDLHKRYLPQSDYKHKYAYIRTNLAKTKGFRADFNKEYQNEGYYASEQAIYYFGEDEINPIKVSKYPMIARILTVNNECNYRSGWFRDTHIVLWDEYNEEASDGRMFKNFTALMKTVKRATDGFEVWLMGNKNDGDSDILVALQIDMAKDNANSWLQVIKGKIFYISIGFNEYDQIEANDPDDLISILASCDPNTDEFMNRGGYLKKRDPDIMLYKHMLALNFTPKRYFTFMKDCYVQGELINGEVAIKLVNHFDDNKIPIIALDNLATLYNKDAKSLLCKEQYKMLARYFKAKLKAGEMYYSDYYTKAQWMVFINGLTQLTIN